MRTIKMLAMAAFCATAATGWARTVSVTSIDPNGDNSDVTLAFGDPDGNAYTLFVAYGVEDGGDDKYNWDNFEQIGTIAADQTTYTYPMLGTKFLDKSYRFFLLQTTDLPYARELKYIKSTGSQYIDTKVIGKLGLKMETRFLWHDGGDTTILGARKGSVRFYPAYMYRYTPTGKSKILSWGYGFGYSGDGDGGGFNYYEASAYDPTPPIDFHVVTEARWNLRNLTVNDKSVYSWGAGSEKRPEAFNTGLYMYIFGCNKDGALAMPIQATLYYMKIWLYDEETKVYVPERNYRPVALANGDGALYDEVHNVVHGNGSTTKFVLGEYEETKQGRSGIVKAVSGVNAFISPETLAKSVVSHWRGGNGNLALADNWCSTNCIGNEVSAAPVSTTEVHFSGNVNACSASENGTLGAAKIFFHDVHLAGNCDLRAFGAAPIEGHLNLNGWKLQLAGLTGTGAITDRPFAVAGYEALDYIESSGSVFISTGVKGSSGVTVEIDLTHFGSGQYCAVGSYDNRNKKNCRFMPLHRWEGWLGHGYNTHYVDGYKKSSAEFKSEKRYCCYNRMRFGSQSTFMNGLLALQSSYEEDEPDFDFEMYLFARSAYGENDDRVWADYPGQMRLYAARFWTGGGTGLARDFVPVRDTNGGKLGLYDKVSNDFKQKVTGSTGTFIAGPIVAASGPAGELWVDVPAGVTSENTGVVIAGSAKLVKSGKGTYRTKVVNHTYTGGTRVADGVFEQGVISTNDSMPMGVNDVEVVFEKEAGVKWNNDGYCFTWGSSKPANTTFTLSADMMNKGFVLTEDSTGVKIIQKPQVYIIVR